MSAVEDEAGGDGADDNENGNGYAGLLRVIELVGAVSTSWTTVLGDKR